MTSDSTTTAAIIVHLNPLRIDIIAGDAATEATLSRFADRIVEMAEKDED